MKKKWLKTTLVISLLFSLGVLAACGSSRAPEDTGNGALGSLEEPSPVEDMPSENIPAPPGDDPEPDTDPTQTGDVPGDDPAGWMDEIRVSDPGRGYFYDGDPQTAPESSLRLELLMEKPNAITDVEEWFDTNTLPDLTVPVPRPDWNEAGELPARIPDALENGLPIIQLGQDGLYYYALYGEQFWDAYILRLYARTDFSLLCTLDFTAYRHGTEESGLEQRVWWAQISGDLLYFSVGHGTYAESMPYHAYLAAVSLTDGRLLWKSEPLVSNAYNFEIIGDQIISGYGFTEEDDYLYQVDLYTGRILDQLPVRSKPDYIIRQDDTLYVRTYNTDYTFRISGIPSDPDTQELPTEAPDISLSDPLSSTLSFFRLRPGDESWTVLQGEEAVSFVACGIHPLDHPLSEETTLSLPRYNGMDHVDYHVSCDHQPDRMILRGWDRADARARESGTIEPLFMQTVQESFLELVPDRIYELTLVWEEERLQERGFCGQASYVFSTE